MMNLGQQIIATTFNLRGDACEFDVDAIYKELSPVDITKGSRPEMVAKMAEIVERHYLGPIGVMQRAQIG